MPLTRKEMEDKLGQAFTPEQTDSLVEVVDTVQQIEIQRAADTRELKQGLSALTGEVHNLAEAQTRTDQRVAELAQAQAKTEQRVGRLEAALVRLAEAQARTEQVLEKLGEAQARTEERMGRLEAALDRLAEAQARTEERVGRLEATMDRLAEAQDRNEQRMEELIEAQADNEREIKILIANQQRIIPRLDNVIGWQLEHSYQAKAYAYFGRLLRRVRVITLREIEEELEDHLSDQEIDE